MSYEDNEVWEAPKKNDSKPPAHVMCPAEQYKKLLDDSRMLKALIAAGARRTREWTKASKLLRLDSEQ